MQEIIETDFRDHTVLAVMHRMKYIPHYDRVAFIEDGVLLEYDNPAKLLASKTRFAELYYSKRE